VKLGVVKKPDLILFLNTFFALTSNFIIWLCLAHFLSLVKVFLLIVHVHSFYVNNELLLWLLQKKYI
jgi:hypothetical protein